MPTPVLAWPVTFAATSYVVRVEIQGSTIEDITISGLTVGRYYWLTGDNQADADGGVGGVGDLCDILETAIESHSNGPTVTVSVNTNGTLNISSNQTMRIQWSHVNNTLDPLIFGFTSAADSALSQTITSPNTVQGLWFPGYPPASDSRDRTPIVGGTAVALSGATRTSRLVSAPEPQRELVFTLLSQAKVLREYEAATDPYGSFEEAWLTAWASGRPVRVYDDLTTLATSSSYSLYRITDLSDPIGRSGQYAVLWDVGPLRLRGVS